MRLILLILTLPLAVISAAPPTVSFNRDIRPIMSDTCFHCHGFDAKAREAGLRLDIREEALKETKEGAVPIVPGNPEKSEIIVRLFDESDPMPPEKAHKVFTPEQKELFRRWVAEGAVYEPHWAYAPLTRPALPAGAGQKDQSNRSDQSDLTDQSDHPIDAFIQARLAAKGFVPSPEAAPEKLRRRLALDLTGLPPKPGRVFHLNSEIETLLASPHFGERMAVWWLDIARFADTVGFHGDQNQRIFPYRDYVIDAFNRNKPFDQFTREQLAGDLLPNPGPEQLIATGYNRLNMMTREGGAQAREYLAKYGAERVRAVAAAWFGSTFGCAECHDHKFDPIKTRDFYELQSFFADVKQWGIYSDYSYTPEPELDGFNNEYPFPPEIEVENPALKQQFAATQASLTQLLQASTERLAKDPKSIAAQTEWSQRITPFLQANPSGWSTPPVVATGAMGVVGETGAIQLAKALKKDDSLVITLGTAGLPSLAALKLELDLSQLEPKTHLNRKLALALSLRNAAGKERKLKIRVGEATAKRPAYRSGAEVPGLGTEWPLPKTLPEGKPLHSVWLLEAPVKLAAGDQIILTISGDSTLPMRLALTPFGSLQPLETLASPPQPTDRELFLLSTAFDRPAFDAAHQIAAQLRGLNHGRAWTMVTQAVAKPISVRVLPRGNWQDETGPLVLPATPSFLPARLESTVSKRLSRLDLANWITSPENPITARAVMNRLWALFFGTGLSSVVDDLGSQGELPSHPELLDWLASEFRDSGWDLKHMVRLIVTSHTYRQSSNLRPELKDSDPLNRLLASQNPRRLEAEFVRDNALAIAGLLNTQVIGGPSGKPYQPADYYEALQFPDRKYLAETDSRQWRRGVYTHWQRTFLHPMMANFDAPARDECAATRTNSNTPQQALTLLNDPAFVEAARVFAAHLLSEKSLSNDDARLKHAYHLTLNRDPKAKEIASLTSFLKSQRDHFKTKPEEATRLIHTGLAPKAQFDPVEHAAWTQLTRVLLNTHETITRY